MNYINEHERSAVAWILQLIEVGGLRGAGNSITARVGAEFILALEEAIQEIVEEAGGKKQTAAE